MPPLKIYTFKYLNTEHTLTVKSYDAAGAYEALALMVKDSEEWLQQI